jgi:hypothetical protein
LPAQQSFLFEDEDFEIVVSVAEGELDAVQIAERLNIS